MSKRVTEATTARPDSWVWLRDSLPTTEKGQRDWAWKALIPVSIIGIRLRAARDHYELTRQELANLTRGKWRLKSRQHVAELENRGNTKLGRAWALAEALTPSPWFPDRLLWWFINPNATLCGQPDLSAKEQFALWVRRAKVLPDIARFRIAECEQYGRWGEEVEVKAPGSAIDGSKIVVVKHPPRSPVKLAKDCRKEPHG